MLVKKTQKLRKLTIVLTILYILLFPLGQLLRIERVVFGNMVVIHPIEVLSIFLAFIAFKNIDHLIVKMEAIFTFFGTLLFSLFLSIGNYDITVMLSGLLYLARFIGFIGIFYGSVVFRQTYGKKTIGKIFLFFGISILAFGWFQYLLYPDLRDLKYFEWDNHIYRIVSTFLDPGYTGIMLSLSSIFSIYKFLRTKNILNIFISISLIFGVLFTYSRSSYIALLAGVVFMIYFSKISFRKTLSFLIPVFFVVILLLPRPGGEGIRLERTASVYARIDNYKEVFGIWKSSPVFGIGFNNLCAYRLLKNTNANFDSHACSGADCSLMMILATSGVVGIISFFRAFIKNVKKLKGKDNVLVYSSLIAVFAHSLFTNSMFYPWVVGWIIFLATFSMQLKSFRD